MYVRHLRLQDFRSWAALDVALRPGVTVFEGANGRGKTNLLEAVYYLATLSSHRVASDQPLIRIGTQSAFVAAAAVNDGRELTVDVTINAGRANRARIRRNPVRRTREVLGVVQAVMFAPEDLALVRGEPGGRRRFLDELAAVRRPGLAGVRADYDKALRQRSALLKSSGHAMRRAAGGTAGADTAAALSTLEVWDRQLTVYGAQIIAARRTLVADLAPHVEMAYRAIAPESQDVAISYRSSVGAGGVDPRGIEEQMRAALAEVRDRELARGVSLVGPHRDDLDLALGGHAVKGYASHGESWSFALALRLGSLALLRADGTDPILLLDDVFAELDQRRRSALAAVAAETEQVLVTAAVPEDVPAELAARRIEVTLDEGAASGRISRLSGEEATAGESVSEPVDNPVDKPVDRSVDCGVRENAPVDAAVDNYGDAGADEDGAGDGE